MLIRSVGLFWHADRVYWGAGSQAGKLWGVPRTNVTADPIDFRDQRGIYVLYAGYEMVYVGQTGSQGLLTRLKQHRHDDLFERWDRFSWFGLRWVRQDLELSSMTTARHVPTNDALDHIEAILIYAAEPALNSQGGRFGKSVIRYVQVRDSRLGLTEHELLREIHDAVENIADE
jgi:hypothetical protein